MNLWLKPSAIISSVAFNRLAQFRFFFNNFVLADNTNTSTWFYRFFWLLAVDTKEIISMAYKILDWFCDQALENHCDARLNVNVYGIVDMRYFSPYIDRTFFCLLTGVVHEWSTNVTHTSRCRITIWYGKERYVWCNTCFYICKILYRISLHCYPICI